MDAASYLQRIETAFDENPELVLDGEIYNHDLKDNFERLISLVKKSKPKPEDIEESRVMQYWLYDIPTSEHGNFERLSEYADLAEKMNYNITRATPSVTCHNSEEIDAM